MGTFYTIKVDLTKKEREFDDEYNRTPEAQCKGFATALLTFYLCERVYQFKINDGVLFWIFLKQTNTSLNDVIEEEVNSLKKKLNMNITYVIYSKDDRETMEGTLNQMPLKRVVYVK